MAHDARQRMIAATAEMIGARGVVPTSVRQLGKAGVPLGSIYHFFPGGKEQLVDEAIQYVGERVENVIRGSASKGALATYDALVHRWREQLVASDFRSGCPVFAAATDTSGHAPRATAVKVLRRWIEALAVVLEEHGHAARSAHRLAWLMMTSVEGALVLARATHSTTPLDDVAEELRRLIISPSPEVPVLDASGESDTGTAG